MALISSEFIARTGNMVAEPFTMNNWHIKVESALPDHHRNLHITRIESPRVEVGAVIIGDSIPTILDSDKS